MPRYRVTLNEIRAYTYEVDADDPHEALEKAKEEDIVAYVGSDFVDYWGEPDIATDVEVLVDGFWEPLEKHDA